MSTPERARALGHHTIQVSEQEGCVRIQIIDPDGIDGRFIDLQPSDGLSIGQNITDIARNLLAGLVQRNQKD